MNQEFQNSMVKSRVNIMKKQLFTRPVSLVLTDEMFEQVKVIADTRGIGISDYVRDAIQEKLANEELQQH